MPSLIVGNWLDMPTIFALFHPEINSFVGDAKLFGDVILFFTIIDSR
jgi:hypothetical protein